MTFVRNEAVEAAAPSSHVWKSVDPDQFFAAPEISDDCVDAANRAAEQFDRSYPGWQLYSRIVRGDGIFDRQLKAWSITLARAYTRAKKFNGWSVVAPRGRRNDWIAKVGEDALHFVIFGRFPATANERSDQLGVDDEVYKRVRTVLTAGMSLGLQAYITELHYQLARVRRENAREAAKFIFGQLPEPFKPALL